MNWQQSRLHHPHQWLLIEAVQAHTEADRRMIDDLAVQNLYLSKRWIICASARCMPTPLPSKSVRWMMASRGTSIMQVERFFEQVKDRRVLIEWPDTFNARRVEMMILTLDEPAPVHRRPHPDSAGPVKIHGDIVSSVPETNWDLPQ